MLLDWLTDYLALIMFASMFFFIFIGYPVAFIMGGLSLIFALVGVWLGTFNLIGLSDIVLRMCGVAADPVLHRPDVHFRCAILERRGPPRTCIAMMSSETVPVALAARDGDGHILAAPIAWSGASARSR